MRIDTGMVGARIEHHAKWTFVVDIDRGPDAPDTIAPSWRDEARVAGVYHYFRELLGLRLVRGVHTAAQQRHQQRGCRGSTTMLFERRGHDWHDSGKRRSAQGCLPGVARQSLKFHNQLKCNDFPAWPPMVR